MQLANQAVIRKSEKLDSIWRGNGLSEYSGTRVRDVIRAAFPQGTTKEGFENKKLIDYCPSFAPDLFGVSALLLNGAGVYSGLCIDGTCMEDSPFSFSISQEILISARQAGQEWGDPKGKPGFDHIPELLKETWIRLLSYADYPIITHPTKTSEAREWWECCFILLIAADEACDGIGLYSKNSAKTAHVGWADEVVRQSTPYKPGEGQNPRTLARRSLTIAKRLNKDLACVQPKVHTASVGCSLRTLSQNLALLPHRGKLATNWHRPQVSSFGEPDRTGFNILMIPLPYEMDDADFETEELVTVYNEEQNKWGWFSINQSWLPDTNSKQRVKKFISFIDKVISKAKSADGVIHGVIFPEYALNWVLFEKIAEMISEKYPSVELMVSGSSTNCLGERGNIVLSANFFEITERNEHGDIIQKKRDFSVHSRYKHHRWKIDDGQAGSYKLSSAFNESGGLSANGWWEKTALPPRELHFSVFREGCIFTSLICEDLARSEPCHEVLRAVGPNLIFVLLMDGPQLPERWPARYSTGLSDDPGCSVLTLTSLALVKRANEGREKEDQSWSVALWKDQKSYPIPIETTKQTHALTVRLTIERDNEFTFDGRMKADCASWRIVGDPKSLSPAERITQITLSKNELESTRWTK